MPKGGISMPPYLYFCHHVANSLPPINKNTPPIFWIATPLGKMGIFKWWQLYYIYDIFATF
jgi:hypothetical protein